MLHGCLQPGWLQPCMQLALWPRLHRAPPVQQQGLPAPAEKTVPVTWYDGDARPPADVLALVTPSPAAVNNARGGKARDVMDQGSIVISDDGGNIMHEFM